TICEKTLGPEHPRTARSLNNIGRVLISEGDFTGAWPLVERALSIYEKALGPEHPDTAPCLNNFARLLHQQGDFTRARPLYERALVICEKAFTADALDALGRTEEAKALRTRYGVASSDDPKPS